MDFITIVVLSVLIYLNFNQNQTIMSKVNELAGELTAVKDKLTKIGTETSSLLTKIDALTEQLANQDLPADAQAALDDLKTQAQVVDELVPDATGGETGGGGSEG